ncbi:sensor histidine kinase [Halobacteriovorax sp. GFR7]|uniref:sensor histidine kinase n=1 Tax=unclassified Halobacteriovorax TaxID=2639665 RepID=UPI003D9846EC
MKLKYKRELLIQRYLIIFTLIMVSITVCYYYVAYPKVLFHKIPKEFFYTYTTSQVLLFITSCLLGKHRLAKAICVLPSVFIMIIIVFTFGGVKSPGILWITGTPIFFGVFYKRSGLLFGVLVMISTFASFFMLDHTISSLSYPLTSIQYYTLLKFNIVQFSILTTIYFFFYVWLESTSRLKLALSNKQLDTLLHVVLHDLSNPITILKLKISSLLRKSVIDDSSYLQINNSLKKVQEIISNVRSFQLDSESLLTEKSMIHPQLIKDYSEQHFKLLNDKNLKLHFDIHTSNGFFCEQKIFFDHILSNLISNAIKFSYDGQDILIKLYDNAGRVYIDIIDKGIGIPKDIIEGLFHFERKTSRLGTKGEIGTGYGLPIVKYFTDFSNGKIKVSSDVNIGTRVSLSFQVAKN